MVTVARRTVGWRDVVLGYQTLQWGLSGGWAVLAPASFYASFPGGGRHWVAEDGPFNEHLVGDVGGLFLALAAVSAYALVAARPGLRRAAGLAVATASVPHVLYHLTAEAPAAAGDRVASAGGLVVGLALAVALIAWPGPATDN